MTKPWARERTKQRRVEAAQRAEEQKEHSALVSTPTLLPISAGLALPSARDERELFCGQYGLHPTHRMRSASGLLLIEDDDPIPDREPSWYDNTPDLQPVDVAPPPRDFSALRSDSSNPWRAIRRRNHRLQPPRRERRPFPQSFPKRTTLPAPRADILALDEHLPDLPPPPTPPPAHVDAPAPHAHVVLAPTLPAETAYGLVHTKLALACARELPHSVLTLEQVFDIVWGPYADDEQKNLVVELPGNQLVFLCTLAAIAAVEPVFEGFLHPVIVDFACGWVDHCRGDTFG